MHPHDLARWHRHLIRQRSTPSAIRRSRRFALVAGLTVSLWCPRVAAGQDSAGAQFVGHIAPSLASDAAAEQARKEQEEPGGVKERRRKKGDKLKLHWRSASLEYGKKLRLDFRSKIRG